MADELIDSFQGRSEIETIAGFAHLLPLRIVAALIGIPREDDELLDAWAEAIAHATDRDAEYRSKAAERAFHELVSYMSKLIARRRGKAGEDLISCLVNAEGSDGTLRLDELIRIAVLLLLAGLETTVNLIGNGILTLLRNPEELERLRNDPFRASTLVEELLRFEPPVHVLYRGTLSDIEVGGAVVPEGSAVQLMLGAANRDPGRFPNADLFLPDRADNQHLGFGSGIHSCFGAPLARLETQIALVAFTRRLISPRLVQDPPPYRFNLTLRGPSELRVAVEGIRPLAVS
jgi:cytochrome P450